MKGNKILQQVLKNPSSLLNRAIRNRVLGNGALQKEVTAFKQGLQDIINLPKIKKQIYSEIFNNATTVLKNLQQKYFDNIQNNDTEKIFSNNTELQQENIINITVGLSSSALLSGLYIPVVQQASGNYGILSLTYISNEAKSYDYPMVSLSTWEDMIKAKDGFGLGKGGANSIFLHQYLHGGRTRKQAFSQTRAKAKTLEKSIEGKRKSVIGVENQERASNFVRKYGTYGKPKKVQ
jgi:hypothetical protein